MNPKGPRAPTAAQQPLTRTYEIICSMCIGMYVLRKHTRRLQEKLKLPEAHVQEAARGARRGAPQPSRREADGGTRGQRAPGSTQHGPARL